MGKDHGHEENRAMLIGILRLRKYKKNRTLRIFIRLTERERLYFVTSRLNSKKKDEHMGKENANYGVDDYN